LEISFELLEASFNGLQREESALSSALGRTARDSKGRLPWTALWPGCGGGAPARRYRDYSLYVLSDIFYLQNPCKRPFFPYPSSRFSASLMLLTK